MFNSLKPPTVKIPAPAPLHTAQQADAAEAMKVMADVWKNEEARFSNLNTRGVAVVSAASLITTVLGVFTKNILDSTASSLHGSPRTVALVGVSVVLGLLVLTVALIVFGVLRPSHRSIFGDNDIVKGREIDAKKVDEVAFSEYGSVYAELAERSVWKAYWLTLAYYAFFFALLVGAATTIYVVLTYKVPPPA